MKKVNDYFPFNLDILIFDLFDEYLLHMKAKRRVIGPRKEVDVPRYISKPQ